LSDAPIILTMSPRQHSVKVAAVQAASVSFDLAASLKKLEKLTGEAASQGAELVAFPEAFLSAYPWRYAFDATIGAREARGMCYSVSSVLVWWCGSGGVVGL
jgi:hypothetical protein